MLNHDALHSVLLAPSASIPPAAPGRQRDHHAVDSVCGPNRLGLDLDLLGSSMLDSGSILRSLSGPTVASVHDKAREQPLL